MFDYEPFPVLAEGKRMNRKARIGKERREGKGRRERNRKKVEKMKERIRRIKEETLDVWFSRTDHRTFNDACRRCKLVDNTHIALSDRLFYVTSSRDKYMRASCDNSVTKQNTMKYSLLLLPVWLKSWQFF